MFENSPAEISSSYKECKPNYEEMAALLKRKIDANKKCLEGMKTGLEFGSVRLSGDQDMFYCAIIGSLSIIIPRQENEYELMLKKIEEEK